MQEILLVKSENKVVLYKKMKTAKDIKKLSDLKLEVTALAKDHGIKIDGVQRVDNDFFNIVIGKHPNANAIKVTNDFIEDLQRIGIQTKRIASDEIRSLYLVVLKL